MDDAADVLEVHADSSSESKCIVNELLHMEFEKWNKILYIRSKKKSTHFDSEDGDKMHLGKIDIIHNHTV
jgi:hypothetical protein